MEILRKFYRPIILFFFIIGIQIYSIGKTNLFAFSDESIANTLHTSSAYPSNGEGDAPVYPEEEIKSRLRNMDLCVPVQYNDVVEGYLKGYLMLYRDKTERILGRTGMYNQYFERALRNADLPIDLQYVTILESALNPKAVSPSAAGGLWQFIPSTAVMYGLAINEFVDERSDPVKSSEIAAKYLAKLYDIFHDWQLALAAYNAGPNKITIAMKQARSNNFSTIKKYLSKETQNYISAFVAAAYVVQNYNSHGLNPKLPELDLLLTQSIRIKEPISFSQISQVTGVPTDLVSTLNPSYSQNYIPYNQAGNWLVIPSRVSKKMLQYLESPSSFDLSDARVIVSSDEDRNTVNYIKTTYTVEEGDNIDKLAKLFNCNAHHIRLWNNLSSYYVWKGLDLVIYRPISDLPPPPAKKEKEIVKPSRTNVPKNLPSVDRKNVSPIKSKSNQLPSAKLGSLGVKSKQSGDPVYHQIKRSETLNDIASKYSGTTVEQIMAINNIKKNQMPKVGSKIIVKYE